MCARPCRATRDLDNMSSHCTVMIMVHSLTIFNIFMILYMSVCQKKPRDLVSPDYLDCMNRTFLTFIIIVLPKGLFILPSWLELPKPAVTYYL